jgi:hypothetical protein
MRIVVKSIAAAAVHNVLLISRTPPHHRLAQVWHVTVVLG